LAQPEPRQISYMTRADALVYCWRLLFHARVHLCLEDRVARGEIDPAGVKRRIERIGAVEFDEIRTVLAQENMILPPRDDVSVYVEFAAVYLELQRFAWRFLPRYFPGLQDAEIVDELLAEDVDSQKLFESTRLPGAAKPQDRSPLDDKDHWPAEDEDAESSPLPPVARPSENKYRRYLRRAERPGRLGNLVRAAIWRTRAARWAPPELAAPARAAAERDIAQLVRRLTAAMDLRQRNAQAWTDALLALLEQTPRGLWTVESRLLYDLQKVCVDHEREIYTIDVVEWALSLGRRPVKRPLPRQRLVLMSKHLRAARSKLAAVRIDDAQRVQLSALLRESAEKLEDQLREQFRPPIAGVLDAVGLVPQNMPERVSREKLIEELLDRIVEHGYTSIGDLRDALSRNQVKLPDLTELRDLLSGDQLLRADRLLSVALDGVCRRGEAYMRWMQRVSALGFGTRFGRYITKYLVVPFGGAYVIVAGVYFFIDDISGVRLPIHNPTTILPLGVFLFGLLNVEIFRRSTFRFFKTFFRAVRTYLVDPSIRFAHTLVVQRVLQSRWFKLIWRLGLQPLVLAYLIYMLLPAGALGNRFSETGAFASIFLAMNFILNSRPGRKTKEILAERLIRGWQRYGYGLIVGTLLFFYDVFKVGLEYVERFLYGVDEWLRFRSGQGSRALFFKGLLSVFWFYATYLIRLVVSVLLEPQINPIKHFPIVTVSHKLLLALYEPFVNRLANLFGIDKALALPIALGIIWSIPGIFGFLAWELRENWKLYAANRPVPLKRVQIGHHGESMLRLLRPGFYSGTIPKRFAKLRRAERKARLTGKWKAARKHIAALNQIEEKLRHFVERELLALLSESKCWNTAELGLQEIHLATNRVTISLWRANAPFADLDLCFETQAGWLLADAASPGWLGQLQPQERQVLAAALIGLYKLGAVDLVRRQIDRALPRPGSILEVNDRGLVVRNDASPEDRAFYDLIDDNRIIEPKYEGQARRDYPAMEISALLFRETPVLWRDWIAFWEKDQTGRLESGDCLAPIAILPE
jgi:hypothetical protein